MSFPVPTTAHFIYIPFVLLIGFVVGFIFGGRAARDELAALGCDFMQGNFASPPLPAAQLPGWWTGNAA